MTTMAYGAFSRRLHERAAAEGRVIKAQVELTYRCNLHCRHCYTDPYNNRDHAARELTVPELHRLMDEMSGLGIVWLNLTGGEIFSHPRFFDLYEYAHGQGFLLQLYSNGTLFTRSLIERLQRRPPFSIDISCHALAEESFDWFTQVPGSFRSFRRGIELLRDSGLPFTIRTKAMNWNRRELPAIKTFVEQLGLKFACTSSLSPRLNGDLSSLDYRLPAQDVVAFETNLLLPEGDGPCKADQPACSTPASDRLFRCGCGTDTIHINAWGELGTCTMQYERRLSLKTHSLEDAVAQVFQEVRSRRYVTSSPCRTCTVHSWCDKKVSDARWECSDAEAPIPYACDVATARAEAAQATGLIHPLRPLSPEKDIRHG